MKSRLLLAPLLCAFALCNLLAQTQQVTFNFTGSAQTWVIPSGVTSISLDVRGAQGGGNPTDPAVLGGKGGRAQTTIAVTPGEMLVIDVGGRGGDLAGANTAGAGGFNGGGTGGIDNVDFNGPAAGGGGASDIRQGGSGLANRVVVAGGGGGAECCEDANGGNGGDLIGMAGFSGADSTGGGGGTQSSGGAGGTGCNGNGGDGSLGLGGVGGNGNRAGGGGGGGYYGGGGGGGCFFGSGGGGGSSYSAGTNTIHTQGFQTGNGQIIISFAGSQQCASLRPASGQILLNGSPLAGVPVMHLNKSLERLEVQPTDSGGNYSFATVASCDYIMPVSSGTLTQPDDINEGPHGYIFTPAYCRPVDPKGHTCSTSGQTIDQNFTASEKPTPIDTLLDPAITFKLPLPPRSWTVGTEAGGYVISAGQVDADPSHTDLNSGFYAIDFPGPCGTPILAPADGTVRFAGANGNFGQAVVLQHAQGVYTLYAHLDSIARGVRKGVPLTEGTVLGFMGHSGLAVSTGGTGAHLHFQFYDNGFFTPSLSQSGDKLIRRMRLETGSSTPALVEFVAGEAYLSTNTNTQGASKCLNKK